MAVSRHVTYKERSTLRKITDETLEIASSLSRWINRVLSLFPLFDSKLKMKRYTYRNSDNMKAPDLILTH